MITVIGLLASAVILTGGQGIRRIPEVVPNENVIWPEFGWYEVLEDDQEESGHLIEGFEVVYQLPELDTGCEVTALDMVLRYYGYDIDKVDLAMNYLPRTAISNWGGSDGRLYGPDMEKYFVGDPSGEGMICGSPAIETAANRYLTSVKAGQVAKAVQGISLEDVYRYIDQDMPLVIWCTIGLETRYETQGWYREDGEYMEWSTNDHGAVLVGYSDSTVTVADPICGMIVRSREQFEKVFESRGNQVVVLSTKGHAR